MADRHSDLDRLRRLTLAAPVRAPLTDPGPDDLAVLAEPLDHGPGLERACR